MKSFTTKLGYALILASLVSPVSSAFAQGYPERPITVVVPFPPGGATDSIGRLFAAKLGEKLHQSVIVENKPGAGTIVGAGYVAKAAPDGYTLFVSTGTTFTLNPAIQSRLPYDPVKNFEPIGMMAKAGLAVLAGRKEPVENMRDLVALAKAAPGKYAYGSSGTGTTAHFAAELIWEKADVKMMHVPYKGSGPSMVDLIGGQIPYAIDTISAAIPQIKSGKIKAIAVTTPKRSAMLPDVPTMAEAGYPGAEMEAWMAVFAPRGLPPDIKGKLEKAMADLMADPDTGEKLMKAGFEPAYASAAQVSNLIRDELPKMRSIARRANISAE
jgi:tripartite-type tricarboxylate transporter receptor subunit TctC